MPELTKTGIDGSTCQILCFGEHHLPLVLVNIKICLHVAPQKRV